MGYCLGRGGIKITLYVVECETPNTFYVGNVPPPLKTLQRAL